MQFHIRAKALKGYNANIDGDGLTTVTSAVLLIAK
jgi:hypothetical protein